MRNLSMFVFASVLAVACSDPEPKSDNADDGPDASFVADGSGQSSDSASAADITPVPDSSPDLPPEPAYCASVSSQGFFADCMACDANGLDCDTIDGPGASGRACGCTAGACPCGLHCGEYEIGPNIVVGNICVR